jgi:YfiH family protein
MDRRTASNGVVYYASPLLEARGVPHGFSTRIGGLSPPPFDSLNLGNPNGCEIQDNYGRIYENYKLFQSAIGVGKRERCWVHQVHGPTVIDARAGQTFSSGVKADAMVTDDPSRALSVRTADCVPVLLASEDGRLVAAVHAGWRGVIAAAVVHAARMMAVAPTSIVAAIGPSIGIDAFEVGPEVLVQFEKSFGPQTVSRRRDDGKGYVDLRGGIRRQLLQLGIPDDRIDLSGRCTARDGDEFFSHRREHGVTGRMASIISPASP